MKNKRNLYSGIRIVTEVDILRECCTLPFDIDACLV